MYLLKMGRKSIRATLDQTFTLLKLSGDEKRQIATLYPGESIEVAHWTVIKL